MVIARITYDTSAKKLPLLWAMFIHFMIFHSIFHSHMLVYQRVQLKTFSHLLRNEQPGAELDDRSRSTERGRILDVPGADVVFRHDSRCGNMKKQLFSWWPATQESKNPRIQKSKHIHHIHHIHHNSPTITATFQHVPTQPPWPAIGSSELGIHLPPAEQIDPWSAAGCWTSGIFNGGFPWSFPWIFPWILTMEKHGKTMENPRKIMENCSS